MINDDNKKSVKSLLKGKALYIALAAAFLAAGIGGYMSSIQKTPRLSVENTTKGLHFESSNEPIFEKRDFIPVPPSVSEKQKEDKPQEKPTERVFDNAAEKLSEEEKKKPEFFSPLSHGVGKDFSLGVPVFSETMKDYRTHNGVDFKGTAGENVYAIGEGTVISVDKSAIWGNTVSVEHSGGIVSKICGLAADGLIENGAAVSHDTVIGVIGEVPVEKNDGPHIHLEVRKDGVLSDPLELLGLSGE